MRSLSIISQLLVTSVLFQSCLHDEPIRPSSQTMQVTFALEKGSPAELPAGSAVVLSISSSSGQTITEEQVEIFPAPTGFVTDEIRLPSADDYIITQFMVVHEGVALYAAPKVGSKFSDRVNSPLSESFSACSGRVVSLEVVSTRNASATDFGYRTLKTTTAPQWKIMVFTRENGALEQSGAWHYVMAPGIAYGGELHAGMNTVEFQGDPQKTYTLRVEKAGYETFTTEFVYKDIRGKGNKPFKVILERVENENAFTITPPLAEGEFAFKLGVSGSGSLVVDWGDGSTETINFAPDPSQPDGDISFVVPTHEYIGPLPSGGYQVSVTGDLDQIFAYESLSVYATDIDPRNLRGLERFSLEGAAINGLLDLSSNSELQSIRFIATYAWELRLPESHEISEVEITAEFSQEVVDMLIENVYRNAIDKNIRSGSITIWSPLQLSAVSAERVQSLVDNYDWVLHEVE